MKRISFHGYGRHASRSGNVLHIETDGAVVNIRVGLTDSQGHRITRVDISPEDASRGGDGEGQIWYQDGPRIIRLHPDEKTLPATDQAYRDARALQTAAEVLRRRIAGPHAALIRQSANVLEHEADELNGA